MEAQPKTLGHSLKPTWPILILNQAYGDSGNSTEHSHGRKVMPWGDPSAEHVSASGASSKDVILGACSGSHVVMNIDQRGNHLLGEGHPS